jgi:hypothetical protein
MKNALVKFVCLTLLLLLNSIQSFSQKNNFSPEVETFIEEKIHHLLRMDDVDGFLEMVENKSEELTRMQNDAERVNSGSGQSGEGEVVVSDINLPESELHAVMNPNDSSNIVIGVMRQDPSSFDQPLTTPIYYTRDFGDTWAMSDFRGEFPGLGLWAGGGDPMLAYDNEGVIHYTWLVLELNPSTFLSTIGLYYMTSADGGENWDFQGVIDISQSFDPITFEGIDKFVDKQWMAVDNSDTDGRDNVYMAYVGLFFDSTDVGYVMQVATKYADSTSFSEPVVINPEGFQFAQFASIDVDQRGFVHATFAGSRDSVTYGMYHTVSRDQGRTFSRPRLISNFTLPGLTYNDPSFSIIGVQDRLYPCPHVIVDQSDGLLHSGRIYCFWTGNGVFEPVSSDLDIYYSFSDDGGLSWSPAFVLDAEATIGTHQYYASIRTTSSGKLAVTYYDRRLAGDERNTDYVLSVSENGGIDWAEPVVLTGASSDFQQIGSVNANFGIGEYNQTLVTEHQVIPIWSDGRTNDGNINVYAAFAPFDEDFTVSLNQWQSVHRSWLANDFAPNPVQTGEWVRWNMQAEASVDVYIQWFNTLGQRVGEVKKQKFANGEWKNAKIRAPSTPGNYYLHIKAEEGVQVQKIVVL